MKITCVNMKYLYFKLSFYANKSKSIYFLGNHVAVELKNTLPFLWLVVTQLLMFSKFFIPTHHKLQLE